MFSEYGNVVLFKLYGHVKFRYEFVTSGVVMVFFVIYTVIYSCIKSSLILITAHAILSSVDVLLND